MIKFDDVIEMFMKTPEIAKSFKQAEKKYGKLGNNSQPSDKKQ